MTIKRIPETIQIDLNGSEVADFLNWINQDWADVPYNSVVRILPNWMLDLITICTDKSQYTPLNGPTETQQ